MFLKDLKEYLHAYLREYYLKFYFTYIFIFRGKNHIKNRHIHLINHYF